MFSHNESFPNRVVSVWCMVDCSSTFALSQALMSSRHLHSSGNSWTSYSISTTAVLRISTLRYAILLIAMRDSLHCDVDIKVHDTAHRYERWLVLQCRH